MLEIFFLRGGILDSFCERTVMCVRCLYSSQVEEYIVSMMLDSCVKSP